MPQSPAPTQVPTFTLPDEAFGGNSIIKDAYTSVFQNNAAFLGGLYLALKSLCILFILLYIINTILSKTDPDREGESVAKILPGPRLYFQAISLIFAVLFYKTLFTWLEATLIKYTFQITWNNDIAKALFTQSIVTFIKQVVLSAAANAVGDAGEGTPIVGGILKIIKDGATPNVFVMVGMFVFVMLAFFNHFMIVILYLKRAFTLLVMTFIAPLVFALSILKPFRSMAGRFFLNFTVFFLEFPLIIIGFYIADNIYIKSVDWYAHISSSNSADIIQGTSMAAAELMNYDIFYKVPLLCGCLILKFWFMKVPNQLLTKLMANG